MTRTRTRGGCACSASRSWSRAGQVEALETLPSFHYHGTSGDTASGALRLAWSREPPRHAVGVFARDEGAKAPGRLIASAKSWLCHAGVDRTAEMLPWQGAADAERLSPVEVSARYLRHIRDAWNAPLPRVPLAAQDIVLTLPASFDEVARELTVRAAARGRTAARRADRRAAGGLLRLDRSPRPRLARTGEAGGEDPGLRYRRRHDRLHVDPRAAERRHPAARTGSSSIAWRSATI